MADDAGAVAPLGRWFTRLVRDTRDHAFIVVDPSGSIVEWEGAAERLYGYSRAEAIGQPFGLIFTPSDRVLGLDAQELSVARAAGRSEDDRWHQRRDGSRFWSIGVVEALHADDGSFAGYVKIQRDRTDARTHIESLEQRVAALEAIVERHDGAFVTLAHDVRNLLAPMQQSAWLMVSAGEGRARQRASELLARQLRVAARLLDDLDAKRDATVLRPLESEPVDLAQAIRAAVEDLMPAATARRIELRAVVPEAAIAIEADLVRLHQAVVNLVSNAVTYTQEGGHVVVSASIEADEAVVRVEDDGIGLEPEYHERIFELFTRVPSEGEDPPEGRDVGLATVRRVAHEHGGGVEVRSPGKNLGSVFTFRFPSRSRVPQTGAMVADPAARRIQPRRDG